MILSIDRWKSDPVLYAMRQAPDILIKIRNGQILDIYPCQKEPTMSFFQTITPSQDARMRIAAPSMILN
jgi:hypothetical protein